MKKNLKRFLLYVVITIFPLFIRLVHATIQGEIIIYYNLIPEICLFNIMICASTILIPMYTGFEKSIIYELVQMFNTSVIVVVTSIYVLFYDEMFQISLNDKRDFAFGFIIVLTVFNVILTVIVQICIPEDKTYNDDYENKYENYLLNKIDSKQESNKNQKEEVKSNEVVRDSEPDTDILAEMLKNYNETRRNFKDSEPNILAEMLKNYNETRRNFKDSEPNIFAEMLKNYQETKEYFKISKSQSKVPFFVSVFSAIAGFIILAVAIYGIINNEHLEVSIIAAVSGAITEIASVVVLGIHNKSALQLNYYYDALHENEKLLSAINMADKLNADKREEMYIEIIRKQIDIQPKNKEDNK